MLIRRRNRRSRVAAVATAVAVAVLALGACDSSDDGTSKPKENKGLGVVAPGKPGEPAKTLSPEEALKAAPDDTPNSADFTYAQMMIAHHSQALEMTELVPKRAASTAVKRLAERIASAQKPEMDAMAGWLKNNGGAKKPSGHDHGAMPGMATEEQLAQLRSSKGAAFDELFLTLMITHHQGAITMATEALSSGNNVLVEEMANDVIAQQTSEMARMRAL
ncbi:DUF305 domain-containing protein [Streptomyces liangshanensis]|uniref:DUF305 domain-containing protein n=1 Tax=Streptomyces liangshanensis TaxID=2717324 RepID=A0A6G9H6L7_9ACTN|nr:DUF305 domain-containing protein [Streptomyces liangshanensis]QIQ06198.1 DUF305 domain-containing protein [Streptomyces liangshanensis]